MCNGCRKADDGKLKKAISDFFSEKLGEEVPYESIQKIACNGIREVPDELSDMTDKDWEEVAKATAKTLDGSEL